MRTATSQRLSPAVNSAIRLDAAFSSDSTIVGESPVIALRSFA
jgi:hypothetical protein